MALTGGSAVPSRPGKAAVTDLVVQRSCNGPRATVRDVGIDDEASRGSPSPRCPVGRRAGGGASPDHHLAPVTDTREPATGATPGPSRYGGDVETDQPARAAADTAPAEPPAIEPDDKDWTWVLQARCPECGFAASDVDPQGIGGTVRDLVPRWVAVLHRDDAAVRPAPAVWSTLEYGAHVRDVMRVFDERVRLMLEQDDPAFANWDQDATALADRYDLQDPATVADELAVAADATATRFDAVTGAQWERTGRRSNGSLFTVRTLGQYFLHDVVHHLHDVDA